MPQPHPPSVPILTPEAKTTPGETMKTTTRLTIAAALTLGTIISTAPAAHADTVCSLTFTVPTSEPAYVLPAVTEAARYWENLLPGLAINVTTTTTTPEVTAQYMTVPDGADLTIAHIPTKTFRTVAKQIGLPSYINGWSGPTYGGIALKQTSKDYNLIKHELGHILGIDHNKNRKSIMYPSVSGRKGLVAMPEDIAQGMADLPGCAPRV